MAEPIIIAMMILCFLLGALRSRHRLGSRQEVLQLFNSFSCSSHRQAFHYAFHARPRNNYLNHNS